MNCFSIKKLPYLSIYINLNKKKNQIYMHSKRFIRLYTNFYPLYLYRIPPQKRSYYIRTASVSYYSVQFIDLITQQFVTRTSMQ